jgi:hypothetical protein
MRRLIVVLSGFLLALAGCALPGQGQSAGTSSSSSAPATPVPTALPTLPIGDYAFLRDGDIWARTGGSVAHAITQLHLSAAGATWGPLVWSQDHSMLAFVLNAPPLAPGFTKGNPVQSTGSLFTVAVATGNLTLITGDVPLLGQHVAWYTDSSNTLHLLFTRAGVVEQVQPGGTAITPQPLTGPQSVWEIAVRGTTLFYSTIQRINAAGTGTAELHAFDLSAKKDRLIASLGAATLPPSLCSGLLCLPDTTTPYVPYAWSVNADGSVIAYQAANAAQPVPTLKHLKATATPAPAIPYHFYLLSGGKTTPQPIFTGLTALAPAEAVFRLAVAPNGQYVTLALAQPIDAPYGPFLQATTAGSASQDLATTGTLASGTPSWSPTSQGFSLTTIPAATGVQTPTSQTYLLNGQSAPQEVNATALVWGP